VKDGLNITLIYLSNVWSQCDFFSKEIVLFFYDIINKKCFLSIKSAY